MSKTTCIRYDGEKNQIEVDGCAAKELPAEVVERLIKELGADVLNECAVVFKDKTFKNMQDFAEYRLDLLKKEEKEILKKTSTEKSENKDAVESENKDAVEVEIRFKHVSDKLLSIRMTPVAAEDILLAYQHQHEDDNRIYAGSDISGSPFALDLSDIVFIGYDKECLK